MTAYQALSSQLDQVERVLRRIRDAADLRERVRACAELEPAMTELEQIKKRVEGSLSPVETHELAQRGMRVAAELKTVQARLEHLRDRWSSETN